MSVELNQLASSLTTKILEVFRYYIYISYRIIKEIYKKENNIPRGTSQGSIFSYKVYRDEPCIIFKRLKYQSLGVIIMLSRTLKIVTYSNYICR